LIDVTDCDGTLKIWTARPTPCFLTRHRVAAKARIDVKLYRQAVRDLALADVEHPGWLQALLTSAGQASLKPDPLAVCLES
jgi:hypothetical protein